MPADNMEKTQLGASQLGEVIPEAKQRSSPTFITRRRSGRKRAFSETAAIDIKNDSGAIAAATSGQTSPLGDNTASSPTVSAHNGKKYRRHSHAGKMETLLSTEEHKTPANTTQRDSPTSTHKPEHITGSGRVYGQDKEDKIVVYVWEHRDMELPLSSHQLKEYAKQVVGGNFKASKSWLKKFLARNELTLPLAPPDIE
ncbi:uncharacterized protein LOC124266369 [Haliotis rubra]|uniref:uncharacterized protein LOC124266369 n=1 Tax=Haliotis rubra TaxID=36100 RepID=UPI001EE5D503|nr:uncharacterized protein LOC124266369 [Haliotis rubra]